VYPASQRFFDALKGPHRAMIVVKSLSIDGTFHNIPISDGTVKVDRTSADVRRSCQLTVTDPTLVPKFASDALSIYGNHLYIYRGILWNINNIPEVLWDSPPPLSKELLAPSNGSYELVPLGVFRISDTTVMEDTDGNVTINVTGSDISANISKNSWTSPVTVWTKVYNVPIPKSSTTPEQHYVAQTVQEAIKLLINDRWGQGKKSVFGQPQFDFAGVADHPLAKPVIMGSNTISTTGSNSPWTDIVGLAAALGAELYIDATGAFTLRPLPDPNTIQPVWDYFDGDGGMLTKATRKLDSSKAVNYVIATGENTGNKTPLLAKAVDADPSSPTYYQGEFGRVVGREPGRKRLTTQAQVQNAADQYLNWFVGGDEQVDIEGVVNPALDTGDVIRVRRRRVGIYRQGTVFGELEADMAAGVDTNPSAQVSQLKVSATEIALKAGEQIMLYTDSAQDIVTVLHNYPKGSTLLDVEPFHPSRQYRKGTIIIDPTDFANAGSSNHYIDNMTIPLDLGSPTQITARERRVGSKKDAIRIGEYSTGY
jgi:hypothetical protein